MRTPSLFALCPLLLAACGGSDPAPAEQAAEAPEVENEVENEAEQDEPAERAEPAEAEALRFQVVNLPLSEDPLPGILSEHAALAAKAGLDPYVELWAPWCGPCKKLEASMSDPRMERAFAGVYLLRLDTVQWLPKLEGTDLDGSAIPVFYELDAQGSVTGRRITGGAWGEDIPENMAPPLDAFFHESKS